MTGEKLIESRPRISLLGQLIDWLKPLGELRDLFLVLGVVIYFFGRIVWAVNTYQFNFGSMSAFDPQYFVAGIGPLAILGGILLIFQSAQIFIHYKWPNTIGSFIGGWRAITRNALIGTFVLVVVVYFLSLFSFFGWVEEAVSRVIGFFAGLAGMVLILLLPAEFIPSYSFFKTYKNIVLLALSFLLSVYSLITYIQFVYPRIPQSLGGALPRCVTLDLTKANLSESTLQTITPPNTIGEIVRSSQVEILLTADDFVLIRYKDLVSNVNQTLEIDKSIIRAIIPCQ